MRNPNICQVMQRGEGEGSVKGAVDSASEGQAVVGGGVSDVKCH